MQTVKKSNVTYRQLDHVLRGMGFDVSSGLNSFGLPLLRYEKTGEDAIIAIRGGGDDELVNAVDLWSAENTITGRGVADRATFHHLLSELGARTAKAA